MGRSPYLFGTARRSVEESGEEYCAAKKREIQFRS